MPATKVFRELFDPRMGKEQYLQTEVRAGMSLNPSFLRGIITVITQGMCRIVPGKFPDSNLSAVTISAIKIPAGKKPQCDIAAHGALIFYGDYQISIKMSVLRSGRPYRL